MFIYRNKLTFYRFSAFILKIHHMNYCANIIIIVEISTLLWKIITENTSNAQLPTKTHIPFRKHVNKPKTRSARINRPERPSIYFISIKHATHRNEKQTRTHLRCDSSFCKGKTLPSFGKSTHGIVNLVLGSLCSVPVPCGFHLFPRPFSCVCMCVILCVCRLFAVGFQLAYE